MQPAGSMETLMEVHSTELVPMDQLDTRLLGLDGSGLELWYYSIIVRQCTFFTVMHHRTPPKVCLIML